MFIINRILWILNIIAGLLLLLSYLSPYINPVLWWVMAFFGLSFPLLFIVNLVFVLWWLVQGKLKLIFSVACLFVGFQHFSKIYKLSGKAAPEEVKTINFMTMNVKGFGFDHEKPFIDSVANYLVNNKIDVVCFQEFWNKAINSKQDVSSYLRKKVGFTAQKFHGIDGAKQGHGTVIFSRYPILRSGTIPFGKKVMNGAVWADIRFPDNKVVRVFCVHLQSNHLTKQEEIHVSEIDTKDEAVKKSKSIIKRLKSAFEERAGQVDILLEQIDTSSHPVIIAGDFNDTQLSYCYRKLRSDRKDAFVESGKGMGNTYVGPFPSYRIDYILFDKSFVGYSYTSGPNFGSDHKLIQTKISLGN